MLLSQCFHRAHIHRFGILRGLLVCSSNSVCKPTTVSRLLAAMDSQSYRQFLNCSLPRFQQHSCVWHFPALFYTKSPLRQRYCLLPTITLPLDKSSGPLSRNWKWGRCSLLLKWHHCSTGPQVWWHGSSGLFSSLGSLQPVNELQQGQLGTPLGG